MTAERWEDLVALFGAKGACAGCWCMWWRIPAAQWHAQKGEGNRRAMARRVRTGPPPGILAYDGAQAVGWCAVSPRAELVRLARSRILAPVDGEAVWSVPCFYVAKACRGRGLMVQLLEAAADYARSQGATWLEGYPVEPAGRQADAFVYTGLAGAFRRAGFQEVARRSPTRPVMRKALRASSRGRHQRGKAGGPEGAVSPLVQGGAASEAREGGT